MGTQNLADFINDLTFVSDYFLPIGHYQNVDKDVIAVDPVSYDRIMENKKDSEKLKRIIQTLKVYPSYGQKPKV